MSYRAHVGLHGYRGLWCFRRADRVVVSAPPEWVSCLEALWRGWSSERLIDASAVEASLGDDCERCIGPAFHGALDPGAFRSVDEPRVRAIAASDDEALVRFREACGDDAWSVSGLNDVGARAYVFVEGTEITAMAGVRYPHEDVADLCVVTDPRCRGEGRGAAVVGAATRAALASGHLVLYQTLESNRAAVRLACSLGFVRYASHVAVRLRRDAPRF